jgi:hypothetical protein
VSQQYQYAWPPRHPTCEAAISFELLLREYPDDIGPENAEYLREQFQEHDAMYADVIDFPGL